jgi:hypothetical protein
MEAHKEGFGFKELQLQLILLEGALSGAFSVRAQWYSNDPLVDEVTPLSTTNQGYKMPDVQCLLLFCLHVVFSLAKTFTCSYFKDSWDEYCDEWK